MSSRKGKRSARPAGAAKQQDRVGLFLVRLYEFVASNIVSVVSGLVALVVFLLAASYYSSYRAREDGKVSRLFYRAQSVPETERIAILQKLVEDYPRSRVANLSRYYLAVHDFEEGEYAEAKELLEQYLREEPDSFLAATALESLGFVHEAEGRYQEALTRYNQVLERFPDSFVARHIQLNIGRCYDHLEQWEAARSAYTEVFITDPNSLWADEAQQRLDAIAPLAPTPTPTLAPILGLEDPL